MIPDIVKTTNAYKVLIADKKNNALSHSYLVVCDDEKGLVEYLKMFAAIIMCEESDSACGECRLCRLIERGTHPDVSFYPSENEKLNTSCPDSIVANSGVRPLEAKKRLFAVAPVEALEKSQNKLLKTLEEPPQNVVLLLGTLNETAVLPTVKSRVKRLTIPEFSDEALFNSFKNELTDEVKLKRAVALSFGRYFSVKDNYERNDLDELSELSMEVLTKMTSSRDVLNYSAKLKNVDFKGFVAVLRLIFGDVIRYCNNQQTRLPYEEKYKLILSKYSEASLIQAVETTGELEKDAHFNANKTMLIDNLLFGVLEGKFKWQKLQA